MGEEFFRMMTVEEVLAADQDDQSWRGSGIPPLQCACGRFAKWGGDRHYYNGSYSCYSYDTICSRCGTLTVECV